MNKRDRLRRNDHTCKAEPCNPFYCHCVHHCWPPPHVKCWIYVFSVVSCSALRIVWLGPMPPHSDYLICSAEFAQIVCAKSYRGFVVKIVLILWYNYHAELLSSVLWAVDWGDKSVQLPEHLPQSHFPASPHSVLSSPDYLVILLN